MIKNNKIYIMSKNKIIIMYYYFKNKKDKEK